MNEKYYSLFLLIKQPEILFILFFENILSYSERKGKENASGKEMRCSFIKQDNFIHYDRLQIIKRRILPETKNTEDLYYH